MCVGCGGSAEPLQSPPPPPRLANSARSGPPALPSMGAWKFAEVPTGTFGPYLAEGPRATVAVWAAREGDKRQWFTAALSEQGQPIADRRAVAEAPADIGLVSVHAYATAAPDSGFLVLSTTRDFSGARLDALTVSQDGALRGGPGALAQSLPEISWIESVPTDAGALVFWAVKRADRASIECAEVGPKGELLRPASEVLAEARAWQVTATNSGAAIAAVMPTTPLPKSAPATKPAGASKIPTPAKAPALKVAPGASSPAPSDTGPISVVLVDKHGKPIGHPLTILKEPTAELDLDLVFRDDRLVLAWTDRRDLEWRVFTAVVDLKNTVVQPAKALTDPFGPQALIRLVPPTTPRSPLFALWENSVERPAHGRRLRVGHLGDDGVLASQQATLDFAAEDGSMPELAGTSNGMAAITLAPLCQREHDCNDVPLAPTFVVLDEKLDVVASEPIRLAPLDGAAVELAWNLNCHRFECLALSAVTTTPAPIFAVQLGAASKAFTAAARRFTPEPPPRVQTLTAVAQTESVSDMAVARLSENTLLAWITYFDPNTPPQKIPKLAPDGRMGPTEALLRVQPLSGGEAQVISYRARSLGGVSLAADSAGKEALLAWAALDQKQPHVFLTVVGPDGKKRRQIVLTHAPGEVSDVAVADVSDGWIVAWIDERSGHSEVYATKVDRQLKRIVPERVLSQLSGPASDVELLVDAQHVFAVWAQAADARGVADIYGTTLSVADASALSPVHAITETRDHSHSPALATFADGAIVAWLEETRNGNGNIEPDLMLRRLDSSSLAVGSPVTMDLEGAPQSASIVCRNSVCRIVAQTAVGNVQQLEALEWSPARPERYGRLLSLSGRLEDAIDPAQSGNDVFYADPTTEGVHLRRAQIVWDAP